jgi:hypothetical protein
VLIDCVDVADIRQTFYNVNTISDMYLQMSQATHFKAKGTSVQTDSDPLSIPKNENSYAKYINNKALQVNRCIIKDTHRLISFKS